MAWMSGRRLTLTWSAPSCGGTPLGYVVEAGTEPGRSNVAAIDVGMRALTYLSVPEGFYFVRVRTRNSEGLSPPSAEVLVNSGNVPSPPGAPRSLAQEVNGSNVTLQWMPPMDGAPVKYLLHVGSVPGLADLAVVDTGSASTRLSFTGVPRGEYHVHLHAVNGQGAGVSSNEVLVIVP
jgi:hypothetical protein